MNNPQESDTSETPLTQLSSLLDSIIHGTSTGVDMESIRAEYDSLLCLLDEGAKVYGVTTPVGHLADSADQPITSEYSFVANHAQVARSLAFGNRDTTLLSRISIAVKAKQLSNGGSGVRPETLSTIEDLVTSVGFECDLSPELSYSSGDVLPAAQLATAIFAEHKLRNRAIGPADEIALINGSHIQLAVVVEMLPKLATLLRLTEVAMGLTSSVFKDAIGAAPLSQRNDLTKAELASARRSMASTVN